VMAGGLNDAGRGLNIVVVSPLTKDVIRVGHFDTFGSGPLFFIIVPVYFVVPQSLCLSLCLSCAHLFVLLPCVCMSVRLSVSVSINNFTGCPFLNAWSSNCAS